MNGFPVGVKPKNKLGAPSKEYFFPGSKGRNLPKLLESQSRPGINMVVIPEPCFKN